MKTIGIAEECNGLYQYKDNSKSILNSGFESCVVTNVHSVTTDSLWHYRFGHPSFSRLQVLSTIDTSIVARNCVCDVCHISKQKKLPFPISSSVSQNCFDLIHMDIWGPLATASIYGHHYFLTIVDNKSRYSWIFPMKTKAEVRSLIYKFFVYELTNSCLSKLEDERPTMEDVKKKLEGYLI